MTANPEVRAVPRLLLTPEEAAQVPGIGRTKVYELILDRTLDSVKVDRRGGARQRPWWSSSRPCALPPRDLRVNPVTPP